MKCTLCVFHSARVSLVLLSTVFVAAGFILLTLAFWTVLNPSSHVTLKGLEPTIAHISKGTLTASVLGIAGCLLFLPGVTGCSGALLTRPWLLYVCAAIVSTSLLLQMAGGLCLIIYRTEIETESRTWMQKTIIAQYGNSSASGSTRVLWNEIFTSLKCCGINNSRFYLRQWARDFEGSSLRQNTGAMFPDSCCRDDETLSDKTACQPYNQGCFDALILKVKTWRNYIALGLFTFVACQLVATLLSLSIAGTRIVYSTAS